MKKSTNTKKARGFTIVELLVVIVVIGILAAISVVSYSGVTKKANQAVSVGNAHTVQSAAESYNSALGYFPTAAHLLDGKDNADATGNTFSRLASGITLLTTVGLVNWDASKVATNSFTANTLPTNANGKTTIGYLLKGSGTTASGACISYWDYSLATPAVTTIFAGDATAFGTTVTPVANGSSPLLCI